MEYSTIMDRLRRYDETLLGSADFLEDFSEEDIHFILSCIDVADQEVSHLAMILITQFPEPVIKKVLVIFPTFNNEIQKRLIMLLMGSDFLLPYQFLLDWLVPLKDEGMVEFIIICLGRTEYMLLPVIIGRLESEDKRYILRLKRLLNAIGFNRLELYLRMMPQIPFERYFREVFGGDRIDQLKGPGSE